MAKSVILGNGPSPKLDQNKTLKCGDCGEKRATKDIDLMDLKRPQRGNKSRKQVAGWLSVIDIVLFHFGRCLGMLWVLLLVNREMMLHEGMNDNAG